MANLLPNSLKLTLYNIIDKLIVSDNIELEVKIRDTKKDKYLGCLEEYLKLENYTLKESNTIDYYNGSERISFIDGQYYKTSKHHLLKPSQIFKNLYDTKVTLAYEDLEITDKPKIYNFTRHKYRKSYIKGNFSVDITNVVTSFTNSDKKETSNELEIEVININAFIFKDLNSLLKDVFTVLFYRNEDPKEKFLKAIDNKIITTKDIYKYFSKARDLEWKDLTRDGILQPFTVSLKAEGVSCFIYFHYSGIYQCKQPFTEIEKIADIDQSFLHLQDSLYIGELMDKDSLKKPFMEDFLYLPYDCLYYNGEDIKDLDYLKRFSYTRKIHDKIIGKNLKYLIREKDIFPYKEDAQSFFNAFKKAYSISNAVNYNTDGFIFTPVYSSYVTNGQKFNPRKGRYLSNILDVCKYKKPEDLTIDLLVKEDGVYSSNGKFKGTEKHPIKADSFLIDESMYDKIIEFKPGKIDGKIQYTFLNDRTLNKKYPNSAKQISINWDLFYDPIYLKTLLGEEFGLLRKYHNTIKSRIINGLEGYVIDIGSGKGGDLHRYIANKKIKDILFVEPDKEFYDEFNRRKFKMLKKIGNKGYNIIQAGGEESLKILEAFKKYLLPRIKNLNETLNINMMISLSFFWKDRKMLNSLKDTIKNIKDNYKGQVKFNFLTIDGKYLKPLFTEDGNHIKLNNVELIKIDDNTVFIDIKDSATVHDQTEYFVDLDDLWNTTGLVPDYIYRALNDEKDDYILSKNELTYSKLFSYGSASFPEIVIENFDCQKLDINDIIYTDGKKMVKNDDKLIAVPDSISKRLNIKNLYRVSSLEPHSIYHSIIKLINSKTYQKADFDSRIKLAEALDKNYKDFKTFLESIPVYTTIIGKDKIETFGDINKPKIYIMECDNGYEAIVANEEGKIKRIF